MRAVILHGKLSRISQMKIFLQNGPRKPVAFLWFPRYSSGFLLCRSKALRVFGVPREPADFCEWEKVQVIAVLRSPSISASSPAGGEAVSLPCVTMVVFREGLSPAAPCTEPCSSRQLLAEGSAASMHPAFQGLFHQRARENWKP